jgi:hypothetical protein
MLNIPPEGILYKVSYKTAEMDQPRYLTELVRDRIVTVPRLRIDLRDLLVSVLDVALTDEETCLLEFFYVGGRSMLVRKLC